MAVVMRYPLEDVLLCMYRLLNLPLYRQPYSSTLIAI